MDSALFEHLKSLVTPERFARMREVLDQRTRYITVVLEDIFQPHNASAVVRTCDALGVQDLHTITKRNTWRLNDEVSLGSAQWLDLHTYSGSDVSATGVLRTIKERGYRIIATTPHERAQSIFDLDLKKGPVALVFGTELTGISEEVFAEADEFAYIPMYGFVESFNISVSVALCLSELSHSLRRQGLDWQLSEKEKTELLGRWVRQSVKRADIIEREFLSKRAGGS